MPLAGTAPPDEFGKAFNCAIGVDYSQQVESKLMPVGRPVGNIVCAARMSGIENGGYFDPGFDRDMPQGEYDMNIGKRI
ncbi:MAG: hypothetical protein IIA14_12620 [SAR324 cluster bacterium]|nr:hypothetical protein [SAR324 cluster bacterium]